MANELTVTTVVNFAKAGVAIYSTDSNEITVTGSGYAGGVIAAATTEAALPLGFVATNGVLWIKNLDASNYIEIGVKPAGTFYPLVRLNFGECYAFRLAQGVAPYVRANTASVNVEYKLLPN